MDNKLLKSVAASTSFYDMQNGDDMESYFDEKIVKFLDNHKDIEYVIFKHQKGDYDL